MPVTSRRSARPWKDWGDPGPESIAKTKALVIPGMARASKKNLHRNAVQDAFENPQLISWGPRTGRASPVGPKNSVPIGFPLVRQKKHPSRTWQRPARLSPRNRHDNSRTTTIKVRRRGWSGIRTDVAKRVSQHARSIVSEYEAASRLDNSRPRSPVGPRSGPWAIGAGHLSIGPRRDQSRIIRFIPISRSHADTDQAGPRGALGRPFSFSEGGPSVQMHV